MVRKAAKLFSTLMIVASAVAFSGSPSAAKEPVDCEMMSDWVDHGFFDNYWHGAAQYPGDNPQNPGGNWELVGSNYVTNYHNGLIGGTMWYHGTHNGC